MSTYFAEAIALAQAEGYLPLVGTEWSLCELPWFTELQETGGLERLEARLGVAIPGAVREFWQTPDLVRLLHGFDWEEYLIAEPRLISWNSRKHLLVCDLFSQGLVGAVPVDCGEDPPLVWGKEAEETPVRQESEHFSLFIMVRIRIGPTEEPYYSSPVPEWKLIAEVRRIAAKLGRRPGAGLRLEEYLRNGGRLHEYHIRESGYTWSSLCRAAGFQDAYSHCLSADFHFVNQVRPRNWHTPTTFVVVAAASLGCATMPTTGIGG